MKPALLPNRERLSMNSIKIGNVKRKILTTTPTDMPVKMLNEPILKSMFPFMFNHPPIIHCTPDIQLLKGRYASTQLLFGIKD